MSHWDGTGVVEQSRMVLQRHPGRLLPAMLATLHPGTGGSTAAQSLG